MEDQTHLQLRIKETAKRLKKYVQKRNNDVESFKSQNLTTLADCIKYNQSEHVKWTFFSKKN